MIVSVVVMIVPVVVMIVSVVVMIVPVVVMIVPVVIMIVSMVVVIVFAVTMTMIPVFVAVAHGIHSLNTDVPIHIDRILGQTCDGLSIPTLLNGERVSMSSHGGLLGVDDRESRNRQNEAQRCGRRKEKTVHFFSRKRLQAMATRTIPTPDR